LAPKTSSAISRIALRAEVFPATLMINNSLAVNGKCVRSWTWKTKANLS
jgi:hypothetical protein